MPLFREDRKVVTVRAVGNDIQESGHKLDIKLGRQLKG